jgi:hypothetical protein
MAKQETNMRALKGLVIAMGVLIVVGLTIVVVTIAMRATGTGGAGTATAGAEATAEAGDMTPSPQTSSPQTSSPQAPDPQATAAGVRPFGELQLGTADSCRIAGTVASGGTLVVRLDGPAKDGCDQLVVVDPGQGRVLGRIRPGSAGGDTEAAQ